MPTEIKRMNQFSSVFLSISSPFMFYDDEQEVLVMLYSSLPDLSRLMVNDVCARGRGFKQDY